MGAKKCEENVCITLPFSIIGPRSNVALVDLVAAVTSVFSSNPWMSRLDCRVEVDHVCETGGSCSD